MLNTAPQIQYSAILDFVYPVGSYFITESSNFNTVAKVQAHFGGTWTQLDAGRFLEAVTSGAGSNKAAGLPNITGTVDGNNWGLYNAGQFTGTGALWQLSQGSYDGSRTQSDARCMKVHFDASKGEVHSGTYRNDVYGKSDTVQPKSRTVYMYRRTA